MVVVVENAPNRQASLHSASERAAAIARDRQGANTRRPGRARAGLALGEGSDLSLDDRQNRCPEGLRRARRLYGLARHALVDCVGGEADVPPRRRDAHVGGAAVGPDTHGQFRCSSHLSSMRDGTGPGQLARAWDRAASRPARSWRFWRPPQRYRHDHEDTAPSAP